DRKRLLGMGDVEIGRTREGGAPQGGVRISQLPAVFCARVAVQHMRHLASRSGGQTDGFADGEIQHRYKGKGNGLDDLLIAVLQTAIEPSAQHGDVIAGAREGACFLDHARIVAKVTAGQNDHSADHRRPGGAEGGRTPDLLIANEALSQLSYGPAKKQPCECAAINSRKISLLTNENYHTACCSTRSSSGGNASRWEDRCCPRRAER